MCADGHVHAASNTMLLTPGGVMESFRDLDDDIAWELASLAARAMSAEPASPRVQDASC